MSSAVKNSLKNRTYTTKFRNKVIEEVLNSDLKNVAQKNGISEQEVETMLKDVGAKLKLEKPLGLKRLGIDEIAVVKGQGNYYVVLVDLKRKAIIGLLENRTEVEVTKYLEGWGQEALAQIEEVSIDLCRAYKKVAETLMPQADIVADRFHVMKQVNEELDANRKTVKRSAEKQKNLPDNQRILSGLARSKYVLLKNEEDLNPEQKDKLKAASKVSPLLQKMHKLKENFRQISESESD